MRKKYDYSEGRLIRKESGCGQPVGEEIGFLDKKYGKYHLAHIGDNLFFLHRLIWVWHNGSFGDLFVNHRDGDTQNNSIENLRLVTSQEAQFMRAGVKGCSYNSNSGKWEAYIKVNQKKMHLGLFGSEEEAGNAYIKAKQKYHKVKERV